MATSACDLINGYFSLWFDEWRLLPVVWLMVSLACGVMNDDLCLWFDQCRLQPVVWRMTTSSCALIDGDFCLCFDWWKLLPNGWLIGFITRSGDFCQVSDWWDLSPRNDYFAINWDVILDRMPIIGLMVELMGGLMVCFPFSGWINGWFNGLFPLQVVWLWDYPPVVVQLMGCYLFIVVTNGCYLFSGLIKEFLPLQCCDYWALPHQLVWIWVSIWALPHQWFEYGFYPISGLKMGFTPSVVLNMGFTPSVVCLKGFNPVCGLFERLYPDNVLIHL